MRKFRFALLLLPVVSFLGAAGVWVGAMETRVNRIESEYGALLLEFRAYRREFQQFALDQAALHAGAAKRSTKR